MSRRPTTAASARSRRCSTSPAKAGAGCCAPAAPSRGATSRTRSLAKRNSFPTRTSGSTRVIRSSSPRAARSSPGRCARPWASCMRRSTSSGSRWRGATSTSSATTRGRTCSSCMSTQSRRSRWPFRRSKVMNDETSPAYHAGMRELQDRFDTRRLADRLEEKLARRDFSDEDRAFIESRSLFFLSTADADGQPDCSYKGGAPGFVRVTGDGELAFPHYDGNGMFRSLGNVLVNPAVALLFIDFERPNRLRVNGRASIADDDPLLASFDGAQLIVRVRATRIFPNCPRYIHRMTTLEPSPYVPRAGYTPPVPKWKRFDEFAEVLPRDDPARCDR